MNANETLSNEPNKKTKMIAVNYVECNFTNGIP